MSAGSGMTQNLGSIRKMRNDPRDGKNLPGMVNWYWALSRPRCQGRSSSCWAFTAVESLEAAFLIQKGIRLRLSIQELLDNCPSEGIFGGRVDLAFNYVREYGLGYEVDYEYDGREDMHSRLQRGQRRVHIKDYVKVPRSEYDLMEALKIGPVAVDICVGSRFFDLKKGEIFKVDRCYDLEETILKCDKAVEVETEKVFKWKVQRPNHAVLLSGYDDAVTKLYTLKNWYGRWWGTNGFFHMPMFSGHPYGQCDSEGCVLSRVVVRALIVV
ncbi:hypothetical protein OROHE_008730 [Orobanche hederae]